jgi:uncharacterized DUF497 family protein
VYIDDFVWLAEIVDKLAAKHAVEPEEVEEVFFNRPQYRYVEAGTRTGEDVYSAGGRTEDGRYLMVFFILKPGNQALILSARDMTESERKYYDRRK